MKNFFCTSISALFLLVTLPAAAQFTLTGSDPGGLRWFSVDTPNYRVIYPEGTDSLARVYALKLEQFRGAEALSSGLLPGSLQWGKTPVVLHPWQVSANGMMLWTPKRMDLYTVQEVYGPTPGPWDTHLVAHESRHLAQLQFGYRGWLFKPLSYLFGEMWPGAASALYPNMPFLEGDAVIAETVLTTGGRARTADFLNYYHVAFDQGDWRNWYRWRYGSFRKAAPDYYALGYITLAGMRYFYGDTLITKRYFDRISARPLSAGSFKQQVRRVSGKPFKQTFRDIMDGFNAIWTEERAARAPFQPMERISRPRDFATDYAILSNSDSSLLVLRSALNRSPELVQMSPEGRETTLRPFSGATSDLFYDPARDRYYWAETVRHPRWEMAGASRICYSPAKDFAPRALTRTGRYYYPQPAPDGTRLAVIDYPVRGGSALVLLSPDDGREMARYPAPDGLQLTQSAWIDETIYVSGVSDGGYGIYRLEADGRFTAIAGPAIEKVGELDAQDGFLCFISDRSGVNEWYRLDPSDGTLLQMTSSPYGLDDATVLNDTLYYTSQTLDGMAVFRTPVDSLSPRRVSFEDVHHYRVEEALTGQEKALAGGPLLPEPDPSLLGAPKRYYKLPHLMRIHSWAPFYVNSDVIQELSADIDVQPLGLGATVFFQNTLGTASGSLGYLAEPVGKGMPWRHSGHLKFNYTGLYPVFELTLDYNIRRELRYWRGEIQYPDRKELKITYTEQEAPLFSGWLRTYVPLSFNSGGWRRGLIPQLTWGFSSDRFETFIRPYKASDDPDGKAEYTGPANPPAESVGMHALAASVRGYVTQAKAPSQTYPSLGIGGEAGWSGRPGLTSVFAPAVYGYLYGYLPGFVSEQGLRLSAIGQYSTGPQGAFRESRVNVLPRGFKELSGNTLMQKSPWQCRVTADYAVPIYLGDLSFLSPLVYITHFELTPHCDATFFDGGTLLSAGASLTAGIANLFWAPFPGRIGVSVSYNGGSAYEALQAEKYPIDSRLHFGLVFSMDI